MKRGIDSEWGKKVVTMNAPDRENDPAEFGPNLLRAGGAIAGGSLLGGTVAMAASAGVHATAAMTVGAVAIVASPVLITGAFVGGVAGLGLILYKKWRG